MSGTGLKQRLAAILAADVAGYSRLMAANERATVAALDTARAVFRTQIESNQGRVIDMAGDSVLAVFETAAGAVSAAVAIQKEINLSREPVPEDSRMRFRIGVHLGDVFEKADGTIYGDGVNIAARLEGLAEPGGITVSESIHTAVRGKVNVAFEDWGEQQVKNIAHPVRAFAVRAEGHASAKPTSRVGEIDLSLPDKPSIAVLPFANMSGDPEQEYFTDGITEDIITELSRFHSLFVIARNSTFTYKGKAVDVRTVAKELGVRYVLEGSIRKSASRIRVTAQLIDASTGSHIWAERYDRNLEDVFAVQEEVTRNIVSAIAPEIVAAEDAKASRKRPGDLSAYEIAARARAYVSQANGRRDRKLCDEGIREAREALAIDPESAQALWALAFGLFQHVVFRTASDLEGAWKEGVSAASRAIECDRSNQAGYQVRGLLLAVSASGDQWDEALSDCRHAHNLNPNDSVSLRNLGWVEAISGHADEGIEHLLQSLRSSPRDPWAFNAYVHLATGYFATQDYAKGLEWSALAARDAPNLPAAYLQIALCYVGLGDIDKAKEALQKAQRLAPEYIDARLKGKSLYRRPEDRERQTVFARIAAGLEDPKAAEALR